MAFPWWLGHRPLLEGRVSWVRVFGLRGVRVPIQVEDADLTLGLGRRSPAPTSLKVAESSPFVQWLEALGFSGSEGLWLRTLSQQVILRANIHHGILTQAFSRVGPATPIA